MSRIKNLEELGNAINQFSNERGGEASWIGFLEEMALVSDSDQLIDERKQVTLMTLHVSKGLEFPFVIIVGLEEGLFPSNRASEDEENELEEERRLAYVGITRARKRLWLVHARSRRLWGKEEIRQPSRFLEEIPLHLTQKSSGFYTQPAPNSFVAKWAEKMQAKREGFPAYENQSQEYREPSNGITGQYTRASSVLDDHQHQSGISVGARVRHPTFGVGSVMEIEGRGENTKVSVVFVDRSVKKFVIKYARLELI